jgi:hypothetical protein
MDNASANPIIVALLCVARCLIPVLILLGVSYLLRRFGYIKAPPSPPDEFNEIVNDNPHREGGLTHENHA